MIILSALLFIGLAASALRAYIAVSDAKTEKVRFDELAESIFDYKMDWTEDLSEVKFGENLKKLLVSCGITPDKNYVKSVFGSDIEGVEGGMSLCVNAVRKSGVISEYFSAGGVNGLIHWKSVSFTLPDGKTKVYSLGRDISDETISRNVTEQMRQQLVEEFEYIRTASANADAGMLSFVCEGNTVYMKTSNRLCAQLGFENTEIIYLDRFLSLVKKEDVLVVQRQINRFISGETNSLYVEASLKTALGVYHTFILDCKYNSGAIDYHHLRTGMIFDTTVGRMNKDGPLKIRKESLSQDFLTATAL